MWTSLYYWEFGTAAGGCGSKIIASESIDSEVIDCPPNEADLEIDSSPKTNVILDTPRKSIVIGH